MSPSDLIEQLTTMGIVDEKSAQSIAADVPEDISVEQLTQTLVDRGVLTEHQGKIVTKGAPESLVIGDYIVLKKLGQGGMGAVYRAKHRVMHREVAVKVLPPAAAEDQQNVQRFLREVRAAGSLVHKNIVTAYDAGHIDSLLYLVMECVDGSDLGAILHDSGEPIPPERAIDYAIQAAHGLSYAHQRGVIHRDIKPGNLLLDKDGTVKILDMGLARVEHEMSDGDYQTLTRTDASMGTAAYMPPEQAMDAKSVDQRGDIYSLGCTLFRLLTNEYPYQRDTAMGTMLAHLQEPIPKLPDGMPDGLQTVIERMMAKQPDDRYASCQDVIAALESVLRGDAKDAPSPPPKPTAAPPQRDEIPVARRASSRPKAEPDDPTLSQTPRPPAEPEAATETDVLGKLAEQSFDIRREPPTPVASRPEPVARAKRSNTTMWLVIAAGLAIVVVPLVIMFIASGEPDGNNGTVTPDDGLVDDTDDDPSSITKQLEAEMARASQPDTPSVSPPAIESLDYVVKTPFPPGRATKFQTEFAELAGVPVTHANSVGMSMRLIPPMVATDHITAECEAVYLSETEVTVGQFRRFVEATGYETTAERAKPPSAITWRSPGYPGGTTDAHPVSVVSYEDAAAFCKWLSEKEGVRYRLPTEMEWWLGSRGGMTRSAYWYTALPGHGSLSNTDPKRDAFAWTAADAGSRLHPVGGKRANPFGFHDMYGNVWEWVTDPDAPAGSTSVRGGSIRQGHGYSNSNGEETHPKSYRAFEVGFRVALEADDMRRSSSGFLAEAPFDADQAKAYQRDFAKLMGLPVELTDSLGAKLWLIPPGTFETGTVGDKDYPKRHITVTRGFYLAATEVTVGQFKRFVEATGYKTEAERRDAAGRTWRSPGDPVTDAHPVAMVSYNDVEAFCAWLSKKEGVRYRPPTEAEWELAARAGTHTPRWYDSESKDAGLYTWSSDNSSRVAQPVGTLKPNPFGVFDMYGNLWEWISDWHAPRQAGRHIDPTGPAAGRAHVVAGGCVEDPGLFSNSVYRIDSVPTNATRLMGFRVVREIDYRPAPAPRAAPPKSGFLAEAPFDAEQAKAYQRDFAKLMGVPVEHTHVAGGKMMLIPPGSYNTGDESHYRVKPRHVTITRGFYLGATEVTVGQFRRFVQDTGYKTDQERGKAAGDKLKLLPSDVAYWAQPPEPSSDSHPVTYVTLADAEAFCAWLSKKEGVTYRVPTEFEWELACRAGSENQLWFGDDSKRLRETDWVLDNANRQPKPVAGKIANPWGLYDMHGNAEEWTPDSANSPLPSGRFVDPRTDETKQVVVCGGSAATRSDQIVCYSRRRTYRHQVSSLSGFRVLRELDPNTTPGSPAAAFFDETAWTEPVNLGPVVNSSEVDGGASLSADGLTLYFHSKRPGGFGVTDLYMTTRASIDSPWTEPVNLGETINSNVADLAPSISEDGLSLYFSSYRRAEAKGTNLYVITRESTDAPWGEPVYLSTLNTDHDEAEPSVSRDGLTLLYLSDQLDPNNRGDIWRSTRATTDAPWGKPVKLDDTINDETPESGPMLSPDGKTLLFKSIRPGGVGEWDLYASQRPSIDAPWGRPVNLRFLNSAVDDKGPTLSFDGRTLIFESNRPGGQGEDDLWMVERRSDEPTLYDVVFSEDWTWTAPENLGTSVNSATAERAPFLTPDGLTLLYFRGERTDGDAGEIMIATRASLDDAFGNPRSMGPPINTGQHETHPVMSADRKTLVFSRDNALWMATRPTPAAPWSKPARLSDDVNGPKYNTPIQLSPDGLTLWHTHDESQDGEVGVRRSTRPSHDEPFGGTVVLESGPRRETAVTTWLSSDRMVRSVSAVSGERTLEIRQSPRGAWTTRLPIHDLLYADEISARPSAPSIEAQGRVIVFSAPGRDRSRGRDLWMIRRVRKGTNSSIVGQHPPHMPTSPAPSPTQALTSDAYEWTEPVNLGALNSMFAEYSPFLTPDGLTLYFSRKNRGDNSLDLWYATRAATDQPWSEPINAGPGVNRSMEFNPSLTADGLTLVFHRAGGSNSGIVMSKRRTINDAWGEAVALDKTINRTGRESTPFLSADGLTLLFASDRPGGHGYKDIWMSTRGSRDAAWPEPVNLGESINSPSHETTPALSADGLTLIFASTCDGGKGGEDLYMSTRSDLGKPWSKAVNLGPLNTDTKDSDPAISADGTTLIFTSSRGKDTDFWVSRRVFRDNAAANADAEADASTIFDGVDFAEIDFAALQLKLVPISLVKATGPRCRPLMSMNRDGSDPLMAVARGGKGKVLLTGTHKLHLEDNAFTRGVLRWMGTKPGGRVYLGSNRAETHKANGLADIAAAYDVRAWTPGQRLKPGEVVLFDIYRASPQLDERKIAQLQQDIENGAGVVIGLPAWVMTDAIAADLMSVWYNRLLKPFDMALGPKAVEWHGTPVYVFDESGKLARTVTPAHPPTK